MTAIRAELFAFFQKEPYLVHLFKGSCFARIFVTSMAAMRAVKYVTSVLHQKNTIHSKLFIFFWQPQAKPNKTKF